MTDELTQASPIQAGIKPLLDSLRELIQQARQKVLQAADVAQVQTCWEIGHHIVEYEPGGASRADYGKRLLPSLAETLTVEFGRGFDITNLRHMRGFFLAFPIRDALRRELSWTTTVPGLGPILVAGPLVAWIIGALEGAVVVGGVSAVGAGLASIGIPKNSILKYDLALKTDKYLLLVHGPADEVLKAKKIIAATKPGSHETHEQPVMA